MIVLNCIFIVLVSIMLKYAKFYTDWFSTVSVERDRNGRSDGQELENIRVLVHAPTAHFCSLNLLSGILYVLNNLFTLFFKIRFRHLRPHSWIIIFLDIVQLKVIDDPADTFSRSGSSLIARPWKLRENLS